MKLVDQVREVLRLKHYAYRTERCYVAWIEQFIRFSKRPEGWRHPAEMGGAEVEAFLTHLAVARKISASTQNQALNALVFLYHAVLKKELGDIAAVRAIRRRRLPTVLSREEVKTLIVAIEGRSGRTTMIYTHVMQKAAARVRSPLDE